VSKVLHIVIDIIIVIIATVDN